MILRFKIVILFAFASPAFAQVMDEKAIQEQLLPKSFKITVMVWTAPAPASGSMKSCAKMVVVEQPSKGAPSMGKSITDLSSVTTVGLDLAKQVFQVHAIDASGRVIVAKAIRRKEAAGVLRLAAALPRRAGGLRVGASLGARADQAWP